MKKTILIAEDDPGILEIMRIVLANKGYSVVSVVDGKFLLKEVNRTSPNLILLDIWMPNIAGDKLVKILKASPETAKIPIVIVSALSEAAVIAKTVGADGFLEKPFDIEDLANIVKKYSSGKS